MLEFTIVYVYVLAMLAGFGLTYFGTVKPSLKCLKIGNWIVLVFLIYWLIITGLSFIDTFDTVHSICIDRRCPDTHWMVKTYFRTYGDDCYTGEDPLIGDEELTEDTGSEEKTKYKLNKTQDMNEYLIAEKRHNKTKTPQESSSDDYYSGEGSADESVYSDESNETSSEMARKNRKSYPGGLDVVSFESRLIGCTVDTNIYIFLSILTTVVWTIFVIHGVIGVYFLIRQVKMMSKTGELDEALKHVSYEIEERMSQNTMNPP
ncbi:hypothetical protein GE061_014892 [Apolygus lucorum]|uniref:Uncharacterized protein n=1 Tax=Apolygus lucorum TaxID=248454 RepID=A0A8S9XLN6_APOLU|nr:hypothetical protein GE061_014892 [Apolygus lucorum]